MIQRLWPNGRKEILSAAAPGAPLRFPAPPRMGMAGHVPLSGSVPEGPSVAWRRTCRRGGCTRADAATPRDARSEAEGPSPPARDAPGRVGSGGFGADRRWGSTPLRTDPSRPIDHFEVRGAIAVVVFDVILELRDRHIVVPTVQQGLPLLLRSVVHDDEPVREGLHRRIAVPLG